MKEGNESNEISIFTVFSWMPLLNQLIKASKDVKFWRIWTWGKSLPKSRFLCEKLSVNSVHLPPPWAKMFLVQSVWRQRKLSGKTLPEAQRTQNYYSSEAGKKYSWQTLWPIRIRTEEVQQSNQWPTNLRNQRAIEQGIYGIKTITNA